MQAMIHPGAKLRSPKVLLPDMRIFPIEDHLHTEAQH